MPWCTQQTRIQALWKSIRCEQVQWSRYILKSISRSYRYALKENDLVETYAFGDHQSPPLDMLPIICKDAADWLAKDSMNVVVVHCKAGKGRTGTVIAALLLYLHEAENADHAMRIYGTKRTTDGNVI